MRVLVACGWPDLVREFLDCPEIELSLAGDPEHAARLVGSHPVPIFPFSPKRKIDLRAARQIRRAVLATKPDILHAFYGKALSCALLGTAWMPDAPKIVSFRGIASQAKRRDPSNWLTYLHSRVAGHACESAAVREGLISSGIAARRCVVTYNSVVADSFGRPRRNRLAPWGIPPDAFVVGTVATARPVKGIDLLMEAAIQCEDLGDTYWVVIGEIRDSRITKRAADPRIRDRVRLLGYREDAKELISGADIFVMPSRREALCRALLEAMAQRICPVVSDAGGLKEAVRAEVDGIVFPKENVSELVKGIRRLHADRSLVRQFAESAYRRACEFFSPAKMAERSLELYRQVLADRE